MTVLRERIDMNQNVIVNFGGYYHMYNYSGQWHLEQKLKEQRAKEKDTKRLGIDQLRKGKKTL